MFYNTYRTTKSSQQNRTNLAKNGAAVINPKERLINLQKREKLKGLLITKFMKKYGIKNPEKLLEDEGEYLSDKYNSISEKVAHGFAILVKSIANIDEGLCNFITLLGDNNDDFIILEDGY